MCSVCGKVNTQALCNKCKVKLEKEFKFQTDNYEEDINKNFVQHHYFFKYQNTIRNQILSLKFHEKPYVYKTIVKFLRNMQKSFEKLKMYDIIIVVPVSKKRKKERGYNQSKLISTEIAKMINAKVVKNVLYKVKNTVPQSTLNKQQREENAKNAYKVTNIQKIQNKKILILDDIYTTGNTVNECAKVLIKNGIRRNSIGVLTIAKD